MDTVVQTAAVQAGWVAALLAFLVLSGFGVLGYIVKQLWTDHRELNVFCREKLVAALNQNARSFDGLAELFKRRPCLAQDEREVDGITNKLS